MNCIAIFRTRDRLCGDYKVFIAGVAYEATAEKGVVAINFTRQITVLNCQLSKVAFNQIFGLGTGERPFHWACFG